MDLGRLQHPHADIAVLGILPIGDGSMALHDVCHAFNIGHTYACLELDLQRVNMLSGQLSSLNQDSLCCFTQGCHHRCSHNMCC